MIDDWSEPPSDKVLDIFLALIDPEIQVIVSESVTQGEVIHQKLPDDFRRSEYRLTGHNIRDVVYCNPSDLPEIQAEAARKGAKLVIGATRR